jgi:hypothetical protein
LSDALDPLLPLMASGPKLARCWPKHDRGARVTYHPLSWLLTHPHPGDAHVSAYSVPTVERRLGTDPPAYARVPGGVPMRVLLIDVDCAAAHRAMGGSGAVHADEAWRENLRAKFRAMQFVHPGGFLYFTRGGARVVYRLARPHVVADGAGELAWKRLYLGALSYLARVWGIVGDPSISDWPRAIRLPFVTRDGVPQLPETLGDPRAVGALDYAPTPDDEAADVEAVRQLAAHSKPWGPALRILARSALPPTRSARAPRVVEPRAIDAGTWSALAEDLGRALRAHHGRHHLHLALAGACYARGVPLDGGPALARAICAASGESDDRPQVWETTAEKIRSGAAHTGFGFLAEHWPDLAAIVEAALPADGGARGARDELDARGVFTEVPAADAAALVHRALEGARMGLHVVRVTEGAGKTRATMEFLRARALAAAGYESVPSAAKTVYVAPSHAVAAEVAAHLAGTRSIYRRGPLAVRLADGAPACAFHVPLSRLVAARHAATTWCDGHGMGHKGSDSPCAHREGCPAVAGAEVDLGCAGRTPAVFVTVHALLHEALGWAGEGALVVIDEDPAAVEAVAVSRADLEAAAAAADSFTKGEAFRAPILRALAAGLERGEIPTVNPLQSVFARGAASLEGDDGWRETTGPEAFPSRDPGELLGSYAVRAVWREKQLPDGGSTWQRRPAWAPRPTKRERQKVFQGVPSAAFEKASTTHALVARLVAGVVRAAPPGVRDHSERAVVSVEVAPQDPTRRLLRAVIASPSVAAALQRSGPTVLLDATADLAVLSALAQGDVPATEIRVADGAPVTRRLLYWSGASRQAVFAGDLVRWDGGLARYLGEALRQACAAGRTIALFTFKPLADVLRPAWEGRDGADPTALARAAGGGAAGAALRLGHYGAARGRNDWLDCDALVSVGDPRPNLGATRAVAAVLGLAAEHQAVYRRATAAEVSQVGGRLRGPWRAAPALHLHVGTVPASSWDRRAEVLEIPRGLATAVDGSAVAEAVRVYGSQRVASAVTNTARRTVERTAGKSCDLAQSPVPPSNPTYTDIPALVGGVGDWSESQGNPPVPTFGNSAQRAAIEAAGGARAVADLLGVTRPIAYHWASGKRRMPEDLLRSLRQWLEERPAAPPDAEGGRSVAGTADRPLLRFVVPVRSGAVPSRATAFCRREESGPGDEEYRVR